MKTEDQPALVLSTAPDQETARKIADALLSRRLAACVNILPGLVSLYRWEGEVQKDQEVQLLIKTRTSLLKDDLIPLIKELHPYQVPELISLPIVGGSEDYLDWIREETGEKD